MTGFSKETSLPAKIRETRPRLALAACAILVVSLAFSPQALAQPDKDKAPKFSRTPKQLAHVTFIVSTLANGLRSYLSIAERYGRWHHIDKYANDSNIVLGFTMPSDPYTAGEQNHLRKAKEDIGRYLADPNHEAAHRGGAAELKKAIDALEQVRKSLASERGNRK